MDTQERIVNFEKMAEANPDDELAWFTLGKLYLQAGRLADAEAALRRALELSPRNSTAHQLLAETLLAVDKSGEAIEILQRGVGFAHEKGELLPRNKMIEMLQGQGVEPPELPTAPKPEPAAAPAEGEILCRRCGRPGAPLDEPPFQNEIGEKIHETICVSCWREWMSVSVKVINELRLNLMSPQGSEAYDQHMQEFLGL